MKRPDDLEINDLRSYRFGGFELDLVDETLRRGDETVNISRRMFQVLLLLVERRGEIVAKDEFFEKVWLGSFVEDNNLTVTIAALRKLLNDDAKQARFIENIPRKGYRFIAHVDVESLPQTSVPLPLVPQRSNRRIRLFAAMVGLLVVLFVVGFSLKAYRQKDPAPRRIESIAVLPFETKDPGGQYLADGLTDGISSALANVPGLRVIDHNSTYHYKNANADPLSIGNALNVESLVSGQLDYEGQTPVVNIVLTDLTTNSALWQKQFRVPADEALSVQQEIIRGIAQDLQRGLPNEQLAAAHPPTENAEAYDLYIRGRHYWNKRADPDIVKSAELFQAALDKDPRYAQAYIGLADAYALGTFTQLGISNEHRISLANSYARKALEIDDTLGEAYAVIAINQCYRDWDFAAAEQNYRRAVELSPNNATAHHWYAEFLAMQGQVEESSDEYAKAVSLDPLSLPIRTDMALSFYFDREYDQALLALINAKEMDPNYYRTYHFLALVYQEKGLFAEAADATEKVFELQAQNGERGAETLEYYKKHTAQLRRGGRDNGSDGYWQAMADSEVTVTAGPYYLAVANAKLGKTDEALKLLEKAFRQHDTGMVWLKTDPALDNLREDPRFKDLLKRVGI